MASFLGRLMGRGSPAAPTEPVTANERSEKREVAPSVSPDPKPAQAAQAPDTGGAQPGPSFVCREPVLGRDKQISGYRFSLPEAVELRLQSDFKFLQRIYDDAVLRNLTSLEGGALLGPRLAFIKLSPDSLDNPRIHQLPTDNTVLMLAPVHDHFDAELIQGQLATLRQAGFAHGWLLKKPQMLQFAQLPTLAASADFVEFDASSFDGMDVKLLLKTLSTARPTTLPPLKLIAGGLGALDEFGLYFQAGFDLFLGQFITRRENWHAPKSKVNHLRIFRLLNLLRSDAEVAAIADELKHDPVLAFKLLRYINSPVIGLRTPVPSLDRALTVLGRDKFSRWLSLMLFDFKTPGHVERVPTEQALSRAYFLESLSAQGNMPSQANALFILGLFSTLDLLLGQSMPDLLAQAKLPEPVHDALLDQPGPYRDALMLAIAAEGQSPADLQQQAALCGLEPLLVSQRAIQSLTRAHEIACLEAA